MLPDTVRIEAALRAAVRANYGDTLTLKIARTVAEEELPLTAGFLKAHSTLNQLSKDVVKDEVEKIEREQAEAGQEEDEEDSPVNIKATQKQRAQAKATKDAAPSKRKRQAEPKKNAKSRKRAKSTPSDVEEEIDEEDEDDDVPHPTTSKSPAEQEESEMSDVLDETPKKSKATVRQIKGKAASASTSPSSKKPQPKSHTAGPDDDESEMSEVLDETPPPKKKRNSSAQDKKSKAAPKAAKSKASAKEEVDPNTEEIRRLQSQLTKCGIRKVWGRELMRCDGPKEKISHLRRMLKDAGMDGRFSEDKARIIKEQRELAADLEAVNEGNKAWGVSGDEGEDGGDDNKPRPRRRLAKGMEALAAFDDDEESD